MADTIEPAWVSGTTTDAFAQDTFGPDTQLEAFQRLEAAIGAVPASELVPMNIDPLYALSVVLGTLPRVAGMLPRIIANPDLDGARVVDIYALCHAFAYANSDYVVVKSPLPSLQAMQEEGLRLRELMLASYEVFKLHGVVQGVFLEGLKGPVGYLNLSHDLSALAQFFRSNWSVLENKTFLTHADIERASILSGQLLASAALRRARPAELTDSLMVRRQAFTLLVRAYEELRRGVWMLRWHERDADVLAPSLYGGRNTGGRKRKATPVEKARDAETRLGEAPSNADEQMPEPQAESTSNAAQ